MQPPEPPPITPGRRRAPEARPIAYVRQPFPESRVAIRSAALGLLIAGALCLYFGLRLVATAPGAADEATTERWYALNNALHNCLAGVGACFLVAAALALTGQRIAMLAATIVELLLVLLLGVMCVSWTIEARASAGWNYQVILLAILAIVGLGSAARCWRLYRPYRGPIEALPPHDSHSGEGPP